MVNAFLFLGIFQSFFLSILIINKKVKFGTTIVLLFWLILTGSHQIFYFTSINNLFPEWIKLNIIGTGFPLLHGPLILLYLLVLTQGKKLNYFLYCFHFIPFILYALINLYYYQQGILEVSVKNGFLFTSGQKPTLVLLAKLLIPIQGGLYPVLGLFYLTKHKEKIKHTYSYKEKIDLKWMKHWIVISIIGFTFIFIAVTAFSLYRFIDSREAIITITSIMIINVVYLGYFGFKQTLIFSDIDYEVLNELNPQIVTFKKETKYSKSGFDKSKAELQLKRLDQYMRESRPYLNAQLSLIKLAADLGMAPNHLSQLLNEQINQNFFDYINKFRVKEFQERLKDPKNDHLTLIAIAYDSGFNSKSSFNNIFKKMTSMTPSAYKKSINHNMGNTTQY